MEAGEPTNRPLFSSLPFDVIFHILKNLPVKVLLRFRCVCKDWNAIITSRSFINTHLLSQPLGHLFSHYFELSVPSSSTFHKTQLCSFFPDQSFSLVYKFEVPLPYSVQQEPCWILIGSLDGLLCLTYLKFFGRELYLWNPSIRKYKTLSTTGLFNGRHRQRFFHPRTSILFGLGFRVHTGDHIIIRIAVFQWRSRRLKSNHVPQAEVYSLTTDSWKKVSFTEDVSKRLMKISSWQYVNLNGNLNWMAMFSDGKGRVYQSILSFDVNKDEFRETRLPSDFKNGIGSIFQRIATYRGSLAVIISGKARPDDGNEYVWLWVMEEYGKVDSWTRTKVKSTGPRFLQGCTLDGKIMFRRLSGNGRRIELLNTETLEEQQFHIPDFQSIHTFKETLVSLQAQWPLAAITADVPKT